MPCAASVFSLEKSNFEVVVTGFEDIASGNKIIDTTKQPVFLAIFIEGGYTGRLVTLRNLGFPNRLRR